MQGQGNEPTRAGVVVEAILLCLHRCSRRRALPAALLAPRHATFICDPIRPRWLPTGSLTSWCCHNSKEITILGVGQQSD
jgi:hypothetical protein